ncbi:matrixin family metalloprotease [Patescibacteria group bacterium]
MKKIILIITTIAVLAIAGVVIAKGTNKSPATVMPSGQTVIVPDQAINNSRALERIVIIHRKKGFEKSATNCGNGICEKGENAKKCPADCGSEDIETNVKCYSTILKGAKLKSSKDLFAHSSLDASTILASLSEWDNKTSVSLFDKYIVDDTANRDTETPDGRNELSFGDYPEPGVIAIATIWGYFSVPPPMREITEFDIMFDNVDFEWGDAEIDSSLMDLQNIATHEIGHGIGLDDMYDEACNEVTMYGYSTEGEIKKRTIEQQDIVGMQLLYGM